MEPSQELFRLVSGYQLTQAISVAARLGISDVLAAGRRGLGAFRRHRGALAGVRRAGEERADR